MEPLAAGEPIDAGAEEELFRRAGQQAAREALVRRWEQADVETEAECRGWANGLDKSEHCAVR